MWTTATREKYSRTGLRYQSDVTDEEWQVIEPLLPKPKARGRRWRRPMREIVNGYGLRGYGVTVTVHFIDFRSISR